MAETRSWIATPGTALFLTAFALAVLASCGPRTDALHLGSTTSTYDSGLLDALVPAFREVYPQYSVKVIAVGSGEALELGRRKDVDVLLVHAPVAELEFVRNGHGLGRRPVMYNDFLIVGPADDPAGLRGAVDVGAALRRIAAREVDFLSRGDDSGTHKRERFLWSQAGIEPAGDWYREAGEGMAAALLVADATGAYMLVDRATYSALRHRLQLVPLSEGDPLLLNVYSVIQVSGARHPEAARDFADWLGSDAGRSRIAAFGSTEQDRPLYQPVTESDPPSRTLDELERALSERGRG
jgi:tungstate transport system substrate-binding protein